MPRLPRLQFPGAYYHVFNRGVNKNPIVSDDRDRKTFLQILSQTILKYQLKLFVYCVMDNHFHLFLKTHLANLDRAMQFFLGQYVHYFNLRYERVGTLFQGRYKSPLVNTEEYAQTLVRYIHQNPIEAGIVMKPEDYSWSSYPCYVGKLPRWPWLDTEWTLGQFHSDPDLAYRNFLELHQQPLVETERKKIDQMKLVLGKPDFAQELKAKGVRPRGLTPFASF